MKRFIRILTALLITSGIVLSVGIPLGFNTSAKTVEQYEQELAAIAKKKTAVQNELKELSRDKASINRRKTALDNEIDVLQEEIEITENMIIELNLQIGAKTIELQKAQSEEDEQYGILKERIRSSYEEGLPGYLEVILGANGLYDMLTRIDMVGDIFNYDQQVYDKLLSIKEDIAQKKLALEETKNKQVETAAQLSSTKKDRENKFNQSIKLLKDLEKSEKEYKAVYEAYEREEEKARNELNKLIAELAKNSQYVGGKLAWPTPGYTRITSPFGMRMHPILKVKKMHHGVDIAAPLNAKVIAANAGTVITAKYHSVYGNYIVINHGGGMATLYAHLNKILVKVGAVVSKGQEIGKVGSTGSSTGPHLHFEVKENSNNVNPMNYFK